MDTLLNAKSHHPRLDNHWPYAILIASLSFLVYVSSLTGNFVWDDVAQIGKNPFIRDLINLPRFFTADLGTYTAYGYPGSSPYYRPLFLVSYAIDYLIWGPNPFGYHVTNVVLHSVCSLLAFWIALKLLNDKLAALLAAAIFAVHPVHAEAVAWIAGRADLLAASFLFTSFASYVVFRDTSKKIFLGVSLAAYMLALFSKEAAMPLPLLLIGYEVSFKQGRGYAHLRGRSGYLTLYIAVFALYLTARIAASGTLLALPDGPPLNGNRLYATPGIVLEYLRLFFLPSDLKLLYEISLEHLPDPKALLSATFVVFLLAAVGCLYNRSRTLFFASIWFLITMLPLLGPTGLVIMADRYLYIPSLGLCLLGGFLFSQMFHRSQHLPYKLVNLLTVLILVVLSLMTVRRNTTWRAELSYYKQALADAPGLPLSYNNLGNWYLEKKMYSDAIPVLRKALELDPQYVYPRLNLGTAYLELGSYAEAIAEFQKAIRIKPGLAEAHYNLGHAYMQVNKMDEAIVQWQTAIKFKPDHSESNNNLGNVYLLRGDYRSAAERYTVALKARPLNAEAHYNLALALERLGDLKGAMAHYNKFATLAPEEHRAAVLNVKRKLESMTKSASRQ